MLRPGSLELYCDTEHDDFAYSNFVMSPKQ